MGSQRNCVELGRLKPRGPERRLVADSRVAQMTMIGFRKLSVESREWRKSLSPVLDGSARTSSETMWIEALLFTLSSVASADMPSCVQYFFMLLRSRLFALALTGSVVESGSRVPKPKKPTDAGGEERSRDGLREMTDGAGARGRSGRDTLTVVPRP